jgi:hypothetical protein
MIAAYKNGLALLTKLGPIYKITIVNKLIVIVKNEKELILLNEKIYFSCLISSAALVFILEPSRWYQPLTSPILMVFLILLQKPERQLFS